MSNPELEFKDGRAVCAQRDYLIEEYKAFWTYYERTLDERKALFDYYFKTVTLPAGVIGLISVRSHSSLQEGGTGGARDGAGGILDMLFVFPPMLLAAVFAVVFLVGLALFVTYAKESAAASLYHKAIYRIRRAFYDLCDDLKHGFSQIMAEPAPTSACSRKSQFGSIKAWRGAVFNFINSAVGTCAIYFGASGLSADYKFYPMVINIVIYGVFFLAHVWVYQLMFNRYLDTFNERDLTTRT